MSARLLASNVRSSSYHRLPRRCIMTPTSDASAVAKSASRLAKPAGRITEAYEAGPDVWSVFNPLVFPNAINLGQGFMNFPPPSFVRDAFCKISAERTDVHHYSHPKGRPRLRKAVADYVGGQFRKPRGADVAPAKGTLPKVRDAREALDTESEILITAGANGAMYSTLAAFLEPGDEVIFLEPFFDQYEMEVKYNGGVPVCVPLIPPAAKTGRKSVGADEWKVDFDLLRAKLGSGKVKAIMLNTPHNPVGKVFGLDELQQLASLCIEYDLLVISDEVYDCLTFDGKEHIRIASLEGMWDRTVTVGSAGKSFACTGWRVGWAVGPEHLLRPTLVAHTRILFCVNSAASEATAIGLEAASSHNYFSTQIQQYTKRRQRMMNALDSVGFPYTIPHGAYFVMADASALQIPDGFEFTPYIETQHRDFKMAYFIAKTCDVVCIPATAFASTGNAHLYENFLRFSFCKDGEIEEAAERLQKLKPYLVR